MFFLLRQLLDFFGDYFLKSYDMICFPSINALTCFTRILDVLLENSDVLLENSDVLLEKWTFYLKIQTFAQNIMERF